MIPEITDKTLLNILCLEHQNTVKPVLRGHLWDKGRVVL
jgi:hypothetical protein